jgi:hypothetical protein
MTEPVQSCFLPGTNIQFAWDSTSLGYLKTCPRLYYYHMIEGWTSNDESVHLRFGIEYHRALQDFDIAKANGIKHDDAVHDTIQELVLRTVDFNPDHKTKTKDNLIRTVIWYLETFKDDSAETVILSDGRPAVEQSFRFELDWGPQTRTQHEYMAETDDDSVIRIEEREQPYILSGHLDRVVTFQGQTFVMDRKTTTTTPSDYYFNQFEPNNQMTLYSFASKVVLDAPVRGVIIDCAQIAVGFSRFVRGFTYRTPEQIEEWVNDLHYWFALQEQFAIADNLPMNDQACGMYGGCRFREVCSKQKSVRPNFLAANFRQLPKEERWNPLKPR